MISLFLRVVFITSVMMLAALPAGAATWYVSPHGSDIQGAGTNWPTAKLTIQAAINLAADGDTVLVTNGVYAHNGTNANVAAGMTNRIVINKAITVQSVKGPHFTTIVGTQDPATINGDSAVRCAYVGNNAVLSGFTLTNGATQGYIYIEGMKPYIEPYECGGGVYCEDSGTVFNCIITGNSGLWAAGAYCPVDTYTYGTFNNCILSNNVSPGFSAIDYGFFGGVGGAFQCTLNNCLIVNNNGGEESACNNCLLNNCTVTGNASTNIAVNNSSLVNCIVYYNTNTGYQYPPNKLQISTNSEVFYTCTTPLPPGPGNFTNAPLFVSAGNFRLGPFSRCADAGTNIVPGFTDLDGQPRIYRQIDMGCYERQIPGDINNDGLVNAADLNTLLTNYSSTVDQTAVSIVLSNYWPNQLLLAMTNVAGLGGTNVTFALTNSNAGAYSVQSSTDLVNWQPLGAAIPRYVFTDTNDVTGPQRYYRLSFP